MRRPGKRSHKKRMLIIVNPVATTVSDRLRNLVVYALQGRYEVEAVSTEAQNHATEIGREVADHGYDIVVAFGGDGTLNEVANGLAGTDVPVSVLPGGSTNVVCRTLGMPNDVVDATEHLLTLADDWAPRKIDLGKVDERHFVFACGVGIDATVVERVDAHPRMKSRTGPYYYSWCGDLGLLPQVPPQLRPCSLRERRRVGRGSDRDRPELRPLHLLRQPPDPGLRGDRDRRRHALGRRAQAGHPARHADADPAALQRDQAGRAAPPGRALRRRRRRHDQLGLRATRTGAPRPFPLQVDGDYIGDRTSVELSAAPGALTIVA